MKHALSLAVLLLALPACNVSPACRCSGALPEGTISAACGDTQCVGGVLYRCTGSNAVAREADTCEPPTTPPPANLRPEGTPDFFFFAVSGHVLTDEPYNYDYLYEQGTIDALAEPMLSRGYAVEVFVASDNLYDQPRDASVPSEFGFLSMLAYMDYVRDTYVANWDNPTRVIVVGHSHGAVWAHLALHVLEQEGTPLPVDILIDLDSVTLGWEDKAFASFGDAWGGTIDAYNDRTGASWPFDISRSRGTLVAGVEIDDLVPSSVYSNLEVESNDKSAVLTPRDFERNTRLDGTALRVFYFRPSDLDENHEDVDDVGSESITYVASALEGAYFP